MKAEGVYLMTANQADCLLYAPTKSYLVKESAVKM